MRHSVDVFVTEHAHVRDAKRGREIDESARLVHLRLVLRRIHAVQIRRRAKVADHEPAILQLPLALCHSTGLEFCALREVHLIADAAKLYRYETVSRRKIER